MSEQRIATAALRILEQTQRFECRNHRSDCPRCIVEECAQEILRLMGERPTEPEASDD